MKHKKESILITGAGGFVGYHLCIYLAELGHEVVGLDITYENERVNDLKKHVKLYRGDFRDGEILDRVCKGIDVAIHLASAHLEKKLRSSEYWETNVKGLPFFLNTLKSNRVKKIVHASSVGVYGNLSSAPANEDTECNPRSVYGRSKLAGEREIIRFSRQYGFPAVILRPSWVYGTHCPRLSKIIRLLSKKRLPVVGKGDNWRHPVYIEDVNRAFHLALKYEGAPGEIFVISGRDALSSGELLANISEVFGLPYPKLKIPLKPTALLALGCEILSGLLNREPPISRRSLEFFCVNNYFSSLKAKRLLGYEPQFSFKEGLLKIRAECTAKEISQRSGSRPASKQEARAEHGL